VSLTVKQQAFTRVYVETGNASEAYRTAYVVKPNTKPETIWQESSRLLANPKVSARVKELQAEAKLLTMVTVESLTNELEEARRLAMADEKGASAAVAAVMGKAKLHGLLVEKNEHTGKNGGPIQTETKTWREVLRQETKG
jgi:phage terminase small subunit